MVAQCSQVLTAAEVRYEENTSCNFALDKFLLEQALVALSDIKTQRPRLARLFGSQVTSLAILWEALAENHQNEPQTCQTCFPISYFSR